MRRTFDGPPGPPRDRDRAAAISRWLDSARHDAAYAVRNLMRQPGFAAVVVLVLGTVIGLHATLATVIAGVILRPWPGVAAAASVVRLFPIATSGHVGAFSADDYRVIAERTRSLAGVIAMTSDDVRVGHSSGDADGVRTVSALLVSGRFFDLLGVGTAAGRGFADADDRSGDPRAVVVLANAFWRARFDADASVIGIDGLAVVTFELPPDAYDDARRRALVADLTDSLRQSPPPGIDAFGFATWEPSFIRRGFQALLRPAGEAAERARNVTYVEISPGYLETLGIRLVAGRDFTSNDAGRNVAVINETMARLFWENENPVGRTFVTGRGAPQEVVGVMRDAHTHSLYTVPPLFYQPLRATRTMPKLLVRTRGAVAANELGRLIARLDPRVRIQTVPLSSALEERLRETRNGPLLAGLLGAFALLLSTVGLSGVFAYAVRQRTREIGIRMALGAPPTAVVRLVIADHALALAAGLGVGLAGAVASTLLMRSRLHGVGRFDPSRTSPSPRCCRLRGSPPATCRRVGRSASILRWPCATNNRSGIRAFRPAIGHQPIDGADLAPSAGGHPNPQEERMFSLTVLDHVRLDSEHCARNYTLHAAAADRLARVAFGARITMATLLAMATAATIVDLLLESRYYQVASVSMTSAAAIGFALYCVFGFEGRVLAHRACAQRLWLVAERYRSLLAEAAEGLIDTNELLARRDRLIADVHAIYESGFAADQRGFEAARLADIPTERAA